jgi:hypothetical protein
VPRLRISGAIHLLPHMPLWLGQGKHFNYLYLDMKVLKYIIIIIIIITIIIIISNIKGNNWNNLKIIQQCTGKARNKELQKAAILGTEHMLRKVLT